MFKSLASLTFRLLLTAVVAFVGVEALYGVNFLLNQPNDAAVLVAMLLAVVSFITIGYTLARIWRITNDKPPKSYWD